MTPLKQSCFILKVTYQYSAFIRLITQITKLVFHTTLIGHYLWGIGILRRSFYLPKQKENLSIDFNKTNQICSSFISFRVPGISQFIPMETALKLFFQYNFSISLTNTKILSIYFLVFQSLNVGQ